MDSYDNKFWHSMSLDDIYAELGSSADGISEIEASLRLQANGNNELIQKPPKTIWQMLKSQIIDPMIIILIFASLFSFILKEWTEAIVILVIVVINSIIYNQILFNNIILNIILIPWRFIIAAGTLSDMNSQIFISITQ